MTGWASRWPGRLHQPGRHRRGPVPAAGVGARLDRRLHADHGRRGAEVTRLQPGRCRGLGRRDQLRPADAEPPVPDRPAQGRRARRDLRRRRHHVGGPGHRGRGPAAPDQPGPAGRADQSGLPARGDRAVPLSLAADVPALDYGGWPIYCRTDTADELVELFCQGLVARRDSIVWDIGGFQQPPLPLEQMVRDSPVTPLDVPTARPPSGSSTGSCDRETGDRRRLDS